MPLIPAANPRPPPAARPAAARGGLAVAFHARAGARVSCCVQSPDGNLCVALDDGALVFIDADGSEGARSAAASCPANAIACARDWAVAVYDDGCARVVGGDGALLLEHAVAAEAEEGKRSRRLAATRCAALGNDGFVAAAGKLIHAVAVPGGGLAHALEAAKPVRALCAAPLGASWVYAFAVQGEVVLVNKDGAVAANFASRRPVRSLAANDTWLAGATFDGGVELWVAEVFDGGAEGAWSSQCIPLSTFCGTDGVDVAWSHDGGGLAISGRRAASFDFTGARPPHPYRHRLELPEGFPDPIPRICLADPATVRVAWAPGARGEATVLATATADGVVRLWYPRQRLKRGGQGSPSKPEAMFPQFYAFPRHDAVHPSGDAVTVAALAWLDAETVCAVYATGDVVAWRAPAAEVPAIVAAAFPPPPG